MPELILAVKVDIWKAIFKQTRASEGSRSYVKSIFYSASSPTKKNSLVTKILSNYNNYVPKIIDQSLANATFIESSEVRDRIKKSSEYYVVGRNPVQGEFMALAYDFIKKPKEISDELLHQMQVIVTTVELVQTYFFFWDDLEDDAKTRLGKPCWHLVDNTGSLAFNDACIMRSFIDEIIRQNFKGELRENILNIYSKVYFNASIGQYLDTIVARSKNYDKFTMQQYNTTNKIKSSFYAIKSPLLLALALSNKLNKETYNIVDDISNDIGILIQIHNDLIDHLHAKGTVSGKSGTDIQEGKCSWVAVAVLQNCNAAQRRVFTENFGSWDPEKVDRILRLYDELDLQKLYAQEEKARFNIFNKKVNELPKDAIPSAEFFKSFYNLIQHYTQDTATLMYDKH